MGCPCSKEDSDDENSDNNVDDIEQELEISSAQLIAPIPTNKEEVAVEVPSGGGGWIFGSRRQTPKGGGNEGLVCQALKGDLQVNEGYLYVSKEEGEIKTIIVERPKRALHHKWLSMKMGVGERKLEMSRIACMPHGAEGEQKVAGWPSWLTSVAGEAIKGWVPLRAESFEMLDKIGHGTYSTVYRAHDLETGKIVAMKKVRFVNMDPESVRFMAREISILRKLDHPNVMRLEGVVASRMSSSLFLVFEYMEHDLAGLVSTPVIKFTESQIKCYMEQLLSGLQHCHSRGVLHRDMKCSNLLIDHNGVLKIGDFGLATFYQPDQNIPLTSRVVTLWYRAPELLLGATDYGVSIDMWSTGCILAELFAGKPIMPGRTEVEQMHKIFKLCGSPSEDYWEKTRLPHATSFKPQRQYKRLLAETFKDFPASALALIDKLLAIEPEDRGSAASALGTEFFTTEPLPCHPSSLPKYPPSKEFEAKSRGEEARRKKADAAKGRGAEHVRRMEVNTMAGPTTDFICPGENSVPGQSNPQSCNHKNAGGFSVEPSRGAAKNSYSNVHPSVAESRRLRSYISQAAAGFSNSSVRTEERASVKEATKKKNSIHYSGPLMNPGGNIDNMLKEHERQIQNAVRKARENRVQ